MGKRKSELKREQKQMNIIRTHHYHHYDHSRHSRNAYQALGSVFKMSQVLSHVAVIKANV